MTRLLTRTVLEALLDADTVIEVLRRGFVRAGGAEGTIAGQRIRTDLPGPGTATALLPGLVPGIPAYTVKVNAKFPAARPALRGVICLHDLDDGTLLALLDSATVTAWRTGLSAALATHVLAEPAATTLGIVGAGVQATLMLRGLLRLRDVHHVTITDTDRAAAERLARNLRRSGLRSRVVVSPLAVAAEAGIVALATWSRSALLSLADTRPGHHLTSLGADEPGKCELSADLLSDAVVIVDDRTLVAEAGALATAGLSADTAAATLGEVLRGEHPGRSHSSERTVYTPVGLPWQDLALAWSAYSLADERDAGAIVDLLR